MATRRGKIVDNEEVKFGGRCKCGKKALFIVFENQKIGKGLGLFLCGVGRREALSKKSCGQGGCILISRGEKRSKTHVQEGNRGTISQGKDQGSRHRG